MSPITHYLTANGDQRFLHESSALAEAKLRGDDFYIGVNADGVGERFYWRA